MGLGENQDLLPDPSRRTKQITEPAYRNIWHFSAVQSVHFPLWLQQLELGLVCGE